MSPCSINWVNKWEQAPFVGCVTHITTHEKVVPIISKPVITRIFSPHPNTLLNSCLGSIVFDCTIGNRTEFLLTITALLMLSLEEGILYCLISINRIVKLEAY